MFLSTTHQSCTALGRHDGKPLSLDSNNIKLKFLVEKNVTQIFKMSTELGSELGNLRIEGRDLINCTNYRIYNVTY